MGKSKRSSEKTIEEKYKKLSLHEQALHRPDTYIGSIEENVTKLWICNLNNDDKAKIILKEISIIPGLYKIFDEILVNARDHYIRCIQEKLKNKCDIIKVNVNQEEGKITVWNNGEGIDIVIHKEHDVWIPTMLFGQLLTSTNYDDDEDKTVGGRNGYGTKLTNIFSTEFDVETVDVKTKQKFYQKWTNNMFDTQGPKIKKVKGEVEPYTQFTFIPDYKKFGIEGISDDFFALMKKRTYDIAMTTNAKVYFNDKLIKIDSFQKYIEAYFPEGSEYQKVIDVGTKRWRVCAVYDPYDQLDHQNISFANGICTSRGGTHVDLVVDQVVAELKNAISKKLKKIQVKPAMIKENLIFFIDAEISNPTFDTQTKEYLTLKAAKLGSKFEVSDAFIKKIIKTGVMDQIIANANAKAEANLSKTDGIKRNKLNIPKLYDAERAGTKDSNDCYLIVTEGDSAATTALSGMNVVGRTHFGVYPLKGKLLNPRDGSPSSSAIKIGENKEFTELKQILGLKHGEKYTTTNSLRYGHVLIMADQDVDGSHIKGLFMNFIQYFWPELAKIKGFITSLGTPVVKIFKGKEKIIFYNLIEYEDWKKNTPDHHKWKFKYYKGLGTHDTKEAQECFEDIYEKIISYTWSQEEPKKSKKSNKSEESDTTSSDNDLKYVPQNKDLCLDSFTLAFEKKRANDRKLWLADYKSNIFLDNSVKETSYHDFINKELITFSHSDNCRSIPNIMDGFKPSQRKIYYTCCKAKLYGDMKETKVSQLAGHVGLVSHYHHGEASLNQTIVGMAQNFVGSNNINLLVPKGQFGSRVGGGTDAASPRYISTYMDEITKIIFNEYDFDILKHQHEDGDMIEPFYYVGVIPNILVNGSEGIGTGWSTNIYPCNPRDIVDNLRRIINGDKPKSMTPWYRHFTGTIEKTEDKKYLIRANYDIISDDKIKINDLPIGTWTNNYKIFLDNLIGTAAVQKVENVKGAKGKKATGKNIKGKGIGKGKGSKKDLVKGKVAKNNKAANTIKTYEEDCTDVRVSFTITFHPGNLNKLVESGDIEKYLKLVQPISLNNMVLFDEEGKIKRYDSYKEILKSFAKVRLNSYQLRKDHLLGKWKKEIDILGWRMKFILYVIKGKIIIFRDKKSVKEDIIIARLEELEFPKMAEGTDKKESYAYLLDMPIRRFTEDQIDKLQKMIDDKQENIDILAVKSPEDLWIEELDEFMKVYDVWEKKADKEYNELLRLTKKDFKKNSKKSRSKKSN